MNVAIPNKRLATMGLLNLSLSLSRWPGML
jgi:hypothetical protein